MGHVVEASETGSEIQRQIQTPTLMEGETVRGTEAGTEAGTETHRDGDCQSQRPEDTDTGTEADADRDSDSKRVNSKIVKGCTGAIKTAASDAGHAQSPETSCYRQGLQGCVDQRWQQVI